jgi:putative ABC transport system permease protein
VLRSYLLTLYRSLTKHQLFSALNIFGLAVGMAVFLVLTIAARFEYSYDRWIPNAERTFRINGIMNISGRPQETIALIPGPALPALQADYGNRIEAGVRLLERPMAVSRGQQGDYEQVVFADPTFFDVFDLPLVAGDKRTAIADTSSIVISEAMAKKYFGQTRALGETLTVVTDGTPRNYRVSAVLRDLPENTHLKIGFIAFLSEQVLPGSAEYLDEWNATNYATYVRLAEPSAAEALNGQMDAFLQRRSPEVAEWVQFRLEPLTSLHFAAEQMGAFKPGTDRRFVRMLQIIGVLTLLLAVINYVNLSTARAVLRAREVALRKAFGATRGALVGQFLIEAVVVSLIAGLISIALVELTLPLVNSALGKELELDYFGSGGVVLLFLPIVLAVGLAAGFYPALVISRYQPAAVLAASRAPGGGRMAALVREVLVVTQFAVSIALLICTAVVFAQADFVRRSDLGFRRTQLIMVKRLDDEKIVAQRNPLMEAFRRVPGVEAVTISGRSPGNGGVGASSSFTRPGLVMEEPPSLSWEMVGDGYFDTYGLRMAAGRKFSTANRLDDLMGLEEDDQTLSQRGLNVILNQAAAKAMQFKSPQDAIGKVIRPGAEGPQLRVVGVAEDASYGSPRDPVPPVLYVKQAMTGAFWGNPEIGVRYRGNPEVVMPQLEAAWRQVIGSGTPFEAETVEAALNTFYEPDDQRGRLITLGAAVAAVIGCLGLYGLAAFTSERRTKEIGIRKVLGASTSDVFRLLVGQFLRPVIIANLIAWPIAYVLMREWLNGFVQRVDLSPVYFVGATLLALLVALLTVTGQALKVARSDPGYALRYE